MKVFLVNLDKDKERLAFMDAQLKGLGVRYERLPAVYAKDMPEQERASKVNAFRWWCAIGRPVAPAEIGCALSHFSIYKRMIEECLPCACILEDDIVVDEQFAERVTQVEKEMEMERPQVVLLSDHTGIYKNSSKVGIIHSRRGLCTDGYCLTQMAAKRLLEMNFPLITPCDHWARWERQNAIELYHALPPVCWQRREVFGSSTVEGRVVVADLPLTSWCVHKGKRCVGKILDWLLTRIYGR